MLAFEGIHTGSTSLTTMPCAQIVVGCTRQTLVLDPSRCDGGRMVTRSSGVEEQRASQRPTLTSAIDAVSVPCKALHILAQLIESSRQRLDPQRFFPRELVNDPLQAQFRED